MSTYVLVHGASHTGELLEDVAKPIRDAGHTVYCPTLAGNRPDDDKSQCGLEDAIASLVTYLEENDLSDVIMMGHSYGGMVITGAADRCPQRIRRLIYWNAFVPNNGESLNDLVPPHYAEMFAGIAAASEDNSVEFPFPVLREAFMNDASLEQVETLAAKLNRQPFRTFEEKIKLSKNPAEMEIGKSYINCLDDTSMPQSYGWHPRLSEKLGLFRLIQIPGGHELCVTNPPALAQAIMNAGRD